MSTKRRVRTNRPKHRSPHGLATRVTALEQDVHLLRAAMATLNDEVGALQHSLERAERLMLDVQAGQGRIVAAVERIAVALKVPAGGDKP